MLPKHIVLAAVTEQQCINKWVYLAEADFSVHVVQVDLLAVRQMPVVFYKQAAAGHVAVGYLFARAVELGHIWNQGFNFVGTGVIIFINGVVHIAFKAMFTAEISAFAPVTVGNQSVCNIGFEGGGKQQVAIVFKFGKAAAGTWFISFCTVKSKAGERQLAAYRTGWTVCRGVAGQCAVVFAQIVV